MQHRTGTLSVAIETNEDRHKIGDAKRIQTEQSSMKTQGLENI
jgi:hypothetical protein